MGLMTLTKERALAERPRGSRSGFLRMLMLAGIGWVVLGIAFTLIIDPYGVSPLDLSWPRINAIKLGRIDIDRSLKPYEVWRGQPRTVFLGSSISEQSIDPSVLDGTRFAPAYNAAIPNASVQTSLDYLEEYLELDRNLRIAIVELHLSDFILGETGAGVKQTRFEFIRNSLGLFVSSDALWSAIITLDHNVRNGFQGHEIKPSGYVFRPSGLETQSGFDRFAGFIWSGAAPTKFTLTERAIDLAVSLVHVARKHGVELIFAATPNHAYLDYYYDYVGAWGVIEAALRRITELATVYSFSQPNASVYEIVSPHMTYWNDPLHPSLHMGRDMQIALANLPATGLPANFSERL